MVFCGLVAWCNFMKIKFSKEKKGKVHLVGMHLKIFTFFPRVLFYLSPLATNWTKPDITSQQYTDFSLFSIAAGFT